MFWELFSRSYEGLGLILPPPSRIAESMWVNAERFRFHTFATLKEMLGGFVLALTAAFPLAWAMSCFKPVRAVLQPLFVVINCVPMFALAPIMVIWFGWSYIAIVVPTALMIFFPLTMNIYQGLCSTPQHFQDFFNIYGATPWQTFYKLQLPWSLPHIFAGFRISAALAGIGAIAGEWAGAQEGLGLLMLESRRAADLEMTFGALACVVMMSMVLYSCAIFLEKRVSEGRAIKTLISGNVASLILASLVLTGCQSDSRPPNQVRLVLDWLPNPNHTAIYAGINKGFFKEQGIDLAIIKVLDPSDVLPYLTSHQIEICLTYMPHTIRAMERGVRVTPIGILIQEPLNALIYRKGERIETPKDLNGRAFGYCIDGFQTGFLDAMLKNGNVVPGQMRNVSFDLVHTLAGKQVDVVYGAYWNIECENLRALGFETDHFPLSAFGVPHYYELIFLANSGSPQASPEFIAAFRKAMQASIDYAAENPEEAFQSYLKANPDKSAKTQKWEHEAWLRTIPTMARQQEIDPVVWNGFIEWLVERNLIKRGGNVHY